MINVPIDADILRRHFVTIATKDYDDPAYPTLPEVAEEVKTLEDWLCDKRLGLRQFHRFPEQLPLNPSIDEIHNALKISRKPWNSADAAVVFVTGHGTSAEGSHWIVLRATDTQRLFTTAIRTSDLVGWLSETSVEHLLVIFDLCYAGTVAMDTIRFDTDFPPTWLVLASVTKNQEAMAGALTSAIAGFLGELTTPEGEKFNHGPYLRVDQFLEAVQSQLGMTQRLALLQPGLPQFGQSPCLPNPRYQPEATAPVEPRRRDLALRKEDLYAHWEPKARGVAEASDPGWLFTGRVELMRRLIEFTTALPEVILITGSAGCGKSAALARLVTLSDPEFLNKYSVQIDRIPPDLRPNPGAVDVALLATGKLPHEVMSQISDALGVPSQRDGGGVPTLDEMRRAWWNWLRAQPGQVTIVVDALDEAPYPYGLVAEVLAQLEPPGSAERRVRLLVGVRSPGGEDTFAASQRSVGQALADAAETALRAVRLRVDQTPLWRPDDLADYVSELLLSTENSPYTSSGAGAARPVAEAVAARAGTSFLIGRLAATSLARRTTVVSVADKSWLRILDDGVTGVFRDDLHTTMTDPVDRERALHLMRAIAFAYGRGLPWSKIWPLVANAVANHSERTYGDGDIAWLLTSRLGAYLTTDQEDGITVYRLFHDALRVTLRERWNDLLEEPR